MKKTCYFSLLALILLCSISHAGAQSITSYVVSNPPDSSCLAPVMSIYTSPYAAGGQIETSWGDGLTSTLPIGNVAGNGVTQDIHGYVYAGPYTIKHVLIQNANRVDSVSYSYNYQHCRMGTFRSYNDVNNDCVFSSLTDAYLTVPVSVKVDSGNVPIDTISATGGFFYNIHGPVGTVYTFTILSTTPGVVVTCPANGVLTDTVLYLVNSYTAKEFAFNCSAATDIDLATSAVARTGRHHASATVLVTNNYCNPQNATFTMNFSPKYNYQSADPAPTTVSGHTLTWDLPGLSLQTQVNIHADFEVPTTWLTPGDTVHSSYYLTPTAGDINATNNTVILEDTVFSSYDPNMITVMPKGDIAAGTKLTYSIEFENTGNDTAMNIHILDTLSPSLLPKTLDIVGSTHTMNISVIKDIFGNNIAKFDFPNINLLDSSHHKDCTGMVVFTIDTKPGLTPGTYIPNTAGIYFDDNEVVMTNTAVKMIAVPQNVTVIGNNIGVKLYPNPANDVLTISTNAQAYNSLEINNTIGQLLIKQNVTQADTKVNVKSLPAGIYTITLKGNGGTKTLKFEKL